MVMGVSETAQNEKNNGERHECVKDRGQRWPERERRREKMKAEREGNTVDKDRQ